MDLRPTIVAKSDQLNADDLAGGSITIEVEKVTEGNSEQQPVNIYYKGCNNKPYKPCKSMRRLLVELWGHESDNYVGRLMTLYLDKDVKYAGVEVGGIRISHVSHINEPTRVLITTAKAKRRPVTIQPLKVTETKQLPAFEDDRMAKAVQAIFDGKVTIDQIKLKNKLTPEQEKQLQEAQQVFNEKNK